MAEDSYALWEPSVKGITAESLLWRFICCVALLLGVIALIIGAVAFTSVSVNQSPNGYPRSCKDIKAAKSGLQTIRPDNSELEFQTYCDMESVGGGWTLVAAIHENNIEGKCTLGDKWSSEQGSGYYQKYNGTRNWQNINLFGDINDLTKDDYKNAAYFNLQGKNVMIWHVPNNLPIDEISNRAFLKYYTDNDFLKNYGSSLFSLYSNNASIDSAGSYRYYNLIAPRIKYLVGNDTVVMEGIPKSQLPHVKAGFVQFRSFDHRGFAYALCPGVKMTTGDSSEVCVGGGRRRTSNTCGDFAGWGGRRGDVASETLPSNSGRSLRDIRSSILIFTR